MQRAPNGCFADPVFGRQGSHGLAVGISLGDDPALSRVERSFTAELAAKPRLRQKGRENPAAAFDHLIVTARATLLNVGLFAERTAPAGSTSADFGRPRQPPQSLNSFGNGTDSASAIRGRHE